MKTFVLSFAVLFGGFFGGAFAQIFVHAGIQSALANVIGFIFSSVVSTTPTPAGNWNSIMTAFTGNLSNMWFPVSQQITGATTLGQPASGYLYTYEAYPFNGYLYNSSGYNNSTSGNSGRTAAVFESVHVTQAGQGDAVAFNFNCIVISTRSGATSFLASPACVGLNGNATSAATGAYLNPVEIDLDDGGFDSAGVAYVSNMKRTVNTAAIGQFWNGWRIQSVGTDAIDAVGVATGPAVNGIDLSGATFSGAPILAPLATPLSSGAACKTGSTEWDASYIYICTATNTWKRATLAGF